MISPRIRSPINHLVLLAALASPGLARAQTARPDSVPMLRIESPMPTLEPIIIEGKEFTTRELVQRAMKGERSKLAGHADATYRITTHVAVLWDDKKEVETHVNAIYGDSTGYTRRVFLGAKAERFKKKDGEWVFDKDTDPHSEDYRISELEEGRFNTIPVYLEQDQEFTFEFLDRKIEGDRVIFHVSFKPKSDFSELPAGEVWIDGRGFRVVHEIYDFNKNPFPVLIKGVRRISVQWHELPGGEWVPRQVAAEIDLRGMPFLPHSVSFKAAWEDFRFDVGYDEKMFGKRESQSVAIAPKVAPERTRPTTSPELFPAAQDTVSEFTGTAVLDSAVTLADTTNFNIMEDYLAKLQREDDAHYSSEVEITNRAFIDSTGARHDSMGIAGLDNDVPLYGSDWEFEFDPRINYWAYNRVEGAVLGGQGTYGRADDRARLSFFGSYATASKKFRYKGELNTELPRTGRKLSLNLSFRDYVEPFGSNRLTLNSIRAFVGGADEQDYVSRVGGEAKLVYEPWDDITFDAGFQSTRERSVSTDADFSFWGDMNQPNPAVDEGNEYAVVAGFQMEGWRWFNAQIAQRLAGGALGGDFRYARTDIMLRARGYPIGRQEFELTLKGVATGDHPPFQQLADVGGLSTVRGYDRRTHVGNHSIAARLEYLFPYDVFASTKIPLIEDLGLQFVPWADAARVGEGDSRDWITSVGLGLQYYVWPSDEGANLRLDFAWPLDNPRDDFAVYLWFVGGLR